jgi:hypothetical protein
MPYPICITCQEKMTLKNGVVVVEYMDETKKRPYQLWNADMATCDFCKISVVFRFATQPFARHFENDFEEKLKEVQEKIVVGVS